MTRRWPAVMIALVVGVLALRPDAASAHAALVSSEPVQNAFLQRAPAEITLRFSEPLDSRSSGIRLLDGRGAVIAINPADFPDSRTMRALTTGLKPGIYNVTWFNVSRIDGHALQGSYPFTVLNADGTVPDVTNSVIGAGTGSDAAPAAEGIAVRGLSLLGLVLVAGIGLMSLLWERGERFPAQAFMRTALFGAAVLGLATLLNEEVLRSQFSSLSAQETILETRIGGYWLTRFGASLLIIVVATMIPDAPRWSAAGLVAGVALYMYGYTATSHAAAGQGSAWAGGLDFAHGMAAVLWIGAVAGIAVSARIAGRNRKYGRIMGRFSLIASLLVFVVVATGAMSAFIEVASPTQLTSTRYGWTLLAKVALLTPLLGAAGWNARWGKRRLIASSFGEPRRFIRSASAEVALGLGVMLAAAFLTQTTVSKSVVKPPSTAVFERATTASGMNIMLTIDPNRTGVNTFRVTLGDAEGRPVDAQRVQLVFRYQEDQTVGASTLNLQQTGAGVFSGQGPYLPLEGQWRVEVGIRRADLDDASAIFEVRPAGIPLAARLSGGMWANPAPGLTWNEFGGFLLLILGLGFALWREPLARLGRFATMSANGATVLGFGAGALLLFGVHSDAESGSLPRNPITADTNSIATGKKLYEANCVACHGLQGVPPRGLNMNPYPLDLTVHVPQHPDGQIYRFIADGFQDTAMRAWGRGDGKFSNDQMWHLVNYLRTLKAAEE